METHDDIVIDGNNLHFYYEGELLLLPLKILEVPDLSDIVNMRVIQ